MPSIPSPGQAASEGTKPGKSSARSRARERGAASARQSSSAGTGETAAPRSRTPKDSALEVKIKRFYMMMGTMVRPFGRFYPVLTPVGDNLKRFSDEAAEAWIELAREDKRVLEMLENMTKASTWGNVIGIHFAIFASSIPGGAGQYVSQVTDVPSSEGQDPLAFARAMGMSEEEIMAAQNLAAQMAGAGSTPVRDQSGGGPGDTVRVPEAPQYAPAPDAQTATAAPPPIQSTVPRSKAAIVTPQELGVTMPGEQGIFPQSTPPNGAAGGIA